MTHPPRVGRRPALLAFLAILATGAGADPPVRHLVANSIPTTELATLLGSAERWARGPFTGAIGRLPGADQLFASRSLDPAALARLARELAELPRPAERALFAHLSTAAPDPVDWHDDEAWQELGSRLQTTVRVAVAARLDGLAFDLAPPGPAPWATPSPSDLVYRRGQELARQVAGLLSGADWLWLEPDQPTSAAIAFQAGWLAGLPADQTNHLARPAAIEPGPGRLAASYLAARLGRLAALPTSLHEAHLGRSRVAARLDLGGWSVDPAAADGTPPRDPTLLADAIASALANVDRYVVLDRVPAKLWTGPVELELEAAWSRGRARWEAGGE